MSVPDYQGHRGWRGWGQPAMLSKAQATEHARLCRAEGKCGAVCETAHLGWAVCDLSEDGCDGSHIDGRLAVVWPRAWTPKPITHAWSYVYMGMGDSQRGVVAVLRAHGWQVGEPVRVRYGGRQWALPCCMEIGAEP